MIEEQSREEKEMERSSNAREDIERDFLLSNTARQAKGKQLQDRMLVYKIDSQSLKLLLPCLDQNFPGWGNSQNLSEHHKVDFDVVSEEQS
ncbi:hypothetical protein C4D60_Mb11t22270 [Musa balbisiana]|uniref:Uncharacterized protein n=1 Tax=Musa balbisiana TaxID=52838 RepID=A0A4S8J5Y9_MUSBA|nr:hypothetical protein C4D60_Mb11t22270 [Musa balbisiana]